MTLNARQKLILASSPPNAARLRRMFLCVVVVRARSGNRKSGGTGRGLMRSRKRHIREDACFVKGEWEKKMNGPSAPHYGPFDAVKPLS